MKHRIQLPAGMTRKEAARSLADWLESLSESFRDHVAAQRGKACAAGELIISMRATDALKLADHLGALAMVIETLASEVRT